MENHSIIHSRGTETHTKNSQTIIYLPFAIHGLILRRKKSFSFIIYCSDEERQQAISVLNYQVKS